MEHMSKLEEMRHQMIEELTQIPQYRALKLMERFLGELNTIYEEAAIVASVESTNTEKKIARALDKHMRAESPLIVKNATHMSVQRVA
jgi:hypothetical protein